MTPAPRSRDEEREQHEEGPALSADSSRSLAASPSAELRSLLEAYTAWVIITEITDSVAIFIKLFGVRD